MYRQIYFLAFFLLIQGIFMLNSAANTHVAFRGKFTLPGETEVEFQLSGASWYVVWLDGQYFYEGPDRYYLALQNMVRWSALLNKNDRVTAYDMSKDLNCFPNNSHAPRLSDPGANNPQLITPYFSHFAFESDGKTIQVKWQKTNNSIQYEIVSPEPVIILIPRELKASRKGNVTVRDRLVLSIPCESLPKNKT